MESNGRETRFGTLTVAPSFGGKWIVTIQRNGELLVHDNFDLHNQTAFTRFARNYCDAAGENLENAFGELRQCLLREAYKHQSIIPTYQSYTAAQLTQLDLSVEFIIDGFLAAEQIGFFGGKSKTLKSSIALEMAISIASGEDFLGRFKVLKPQNVYFMSAESGLAVLREKAIACCRCKGFELEALGAELAFSDSICRISELPHLSALERELERYDAKLLVIDPTYLALPGDELSNVFARGESLLHFKTFCQGLKITVVLVHHAKKTITHFNPLELDDFAGAGFSEFARQWFLINRREKYDDESPEKHKLWFTFGGSAGHCGGWAVDINEGTRSNRKWDVEIIPMREAKQQRTVASEQKRIEQRKLKASTENEESKKEFTDALKSLPNERGTPPDIAKLCTFGERTKRFSATRAQLLKSGEIAVCEIHKGNNKKSYEGYRLVRKPNH